MNAINRFLAFLFLILFANSVSAQLLLSDNQYDSLLFQQKIVSIDEFMDRFNSDSVSVDTLAKFRQLCGVCNRDALAQNSDRWFSFLSDLSQDSVRLLFTDTNWTAIATCVVLVDGVEDTVTLSLKVEQVKRSIYKWVISKATGKCLSLSPLLLSMPFSISPVNNEVNFMSLSDITVSNGQNILCYASRNFPVDETSVFFSLVAKGHLKIKYVVYLDYQFDLPNYTFFVSYFNRDTSNSGWLISDFVDKRPSINVDAPNAKSE